MIQTIIKLFAICFFLSSAVIQFGSVYILEHFKGNEFVDVLLEVLLQGTLLTFGLFFILRKELSCLKILTSEIEKLKNGELSHSDIPLFSTEFNVVSDMLAESKLQLANTIGSCKSTMESINESDLGTKQIVAAFVANSEQELQEIEQIATAATELSATAREVADNAVNAERANAVMSEAIENGVQVLDRTQTIVSDINSSLGSAFAIVSELRAYSEEINPIVEMISSVSEQTNLLALNAAIEAARAGEYGRGFAVVAEEVRALAERTQKSTVNIQEVVARLQAKSNEADEIMSVNSSLIDESMKVTTDLNSAFSSISNEVSQLASINAMVAAASEEQSTVTEDISMRINDVNRGVEENLQNVYKAADGMKARTSWLSDLTQKLSFFNV
ncbi:methyl-accepting chemotaxis protein [Vibrio owensii]|uniref:methyl-accepting chemotaxis protein n=1 Tax=Vibrio owensii TaxID=696485 RepID=UPI00036669D4|nr:methyl-accepting chemotaxis protein [Vibrio owensii]